MNKKLLIGLSAVTMMIASSITIHAGEWRKDNIGWWYQNDDGSYPIDSWQWIDGNNDGIAESYYFGGNGYLFVNTITPDGYYVNENGAWVLNGVMQSKLMANEVNSHKPPVIEEHIVVEVPAGLYLVGRDLPAGEYIAVNDSGSCYVKIGADPNMNTMYASEYHDYCIPFKVREGDWIESSWGMIYSIDDVNLDISKTGMYVVGKHVRAGNYILEARGHGYYCITRGMLGENDSIEDNDNFETMAYITLKNGQCIQVSRCSNNFVAP